MFSFYSTCSIFSSVRFFIHSPVRLPVLTPFRFRFNFGICFCTSTVGTFIIGQFYFFRSVCCLKRCNSNIFATVILVGTLGNILEHVQIDEVPTGITFNRFVFAKINMSFSIDLFFAHFLKIKKKIRHSGYDFLSDSRKISFVIIKWIWNEPDCN